LYLAFLAPFFTQPDVQAGLLHRYSFTNGDTTAVDSIGGKHGTLEGGAKIIINAVQLDGINDYVKLPGGLITGLTTLTFEAWFTSAVDSGTWTRVWDFGNTNPTSGAGRNYVFFTSKSGSNIFRYAISDADPGYNHENMIQAAPTTTGAPVYVACTHNSSNGIVKLYVNGQLVSSGTFSIPLSSINNVFSYLGKSTYNGDPLLKGSIDEFRISDSVLTPQEIAEHYSAGPDVIGLSPIVIQETGGSTEVAEGDIVGDEYTVAPASQPQDTVTLTVDPDEQLDIGNGPGNPVNIVFDTNNWNSKQTIVVRAFDDTVLEANPHIGLISHFISSKDPKFNNVPLATIRVTIWENECGAWGYNYADLNYDCIVNFKDLAIFASYWLSALNPTTLETLALEWLETTQPYDPNAHSGPVEDTPEGLFIEPDKIVCEIDEKIYGHFLEHIYHSVNGGLWGELVWNRSLEQWPGGAGSWFIDGNELVQSSLNTDVRLLFGNTNWQNYEYTLQAKKTGGSEGFLIIFRANGDNFYWCNLGGWSNVKHALEKSVTGPSRSIVGPQVTGSIATDHWYNIRIRCEGGHYQVWLDGSKIIDWTDTSSPHLSGQVGIGTWATTARFRNIAVTEVGSGTILYNGLPNMNNQQSVPLYWTSYGNGSFYLNTGALNSDFCLQINNSNGGAETGIEQTPFNLTTQHYSGSIWARGTTSGSMVVRLLDGATILGQAVLPGPTANWAEYPFSITPTTPAKNATLQVGVTGSGTVYLDQISMMGQDSIDTGGYRPDLLQAVDDLHPPAIRWPGGCFASAYLWKDGIGKQYQRTKYPIVLWNDQDVDSYGTDEFIQMCHAMGTEPIIVINTGILNSTCGVGIPNKKTSSEYLLDAMDWVEYCNGPADSAWGAVRAANGHPEPYNVKYWEIDNETWAAGSSAYCDTVKQFAPALKSVDPTIKIIACGGSGYDQSWNQAVINACANIINYISIHHYEDAANYQTGPTSFESHIYQLGNIIAASSNPNIKIDMSEWNAQSTDWRTGLYAGGLLNAFERNGGVFEIGGPALFLRHLSATDWDNAFINFNHTGWFAAPNYVVMKLWHDNYAPYRINMTGPVGNLNAIATKSADGSKIYFKVVNPTDLSVPVKLVISDTFKADSVSLQLVAPGSLSARNSLTSPNAVHVEDRYASLNDQTIRFTMPRLSAGVVQISRKQ
jgi:alpha-N-arabinofuranosidase